MADAASPVEAAPEKAQAPAPQQPAPEDSAKKEENAAKRKKWLIRLAIGVAVVGVLWAAYYLLFARNYVSTDNAYVNAEVAQVTPLISAQVTEIRVSDTQSVKKGDVLARLDPSNARISVSQAEADLAEARRRFRQTKASSTALSSQVQARGADIAQARARLAAVQSDGFRARS